MIAWLVSAWSCGGSDIGTGPTEEPVVTTVSLTPADLSFSSLGDSARLAVEVLDQFGAPMGGLPVTWVSSDPFVATVTGDGLVTAAKNGTATIEATVGQAFASVSVSVSQVPVFLTVEPSPLVLNGPGDTLQAVGVVRDAGGAAIAGTAVVWSSSDASVASVSTTGLLTAFATGAATITAASGALTTDVALTVTTLPASIAASETLIGFSSLGDTVVLTAVVRDGNGEEIIGAAIVWMSLDTTVAAVDDGRVVANGSGSTLVVASAGLVADTVSVDVVQVATAISVSPDAISLNGPGDTLRAAGIVLDAGGSAIPGESVSWSSTDPAIATVDGAGLVTGIAVGETVIMAQAGSLSAQVPVSVTQTPASITLSTDSVSLSAVGDTLSIEAVVRDGNGAVIQGASVTWASSDSSVATVDGGFLTTTGFGSATIRASAGTQSAEVIVIVQQPAQGPSFSLVVNEIFVRRGCTASGCHGRGAGGMNLSATPATSYSSLVNVQSVGEPAFKRVLPNDATNSYLVIKLEGRQASGGRMPLGAAPLNAADMANIRNWINAGAQNN